ncbi:hypothetical protein U9R71_20370 [Bacillus toyonensis]|uniref:hypothetical protein n=1 Tax=Bacillus toyonensis TaxID=155322 RepID=UPI001443C843|nr:hypothetical protein [Bacillus toyonensis]NKW95825.1 hypothetical protein [Bacillus toyonensis]
MAWFLNKDTGITWEVTDADQLNRCKKDPTYEEVDEPKTEIVKKKRRVAPTQVGE